jgi:hypothetical protein
MPKRKYDPLIVCGDFLQGKCHATRCKKNGQNIFLFAPFHPRKLAAFDDAVTNYEIAATNKDFEAAREWENAVRGLMTTVCEHHRAMEAKSVIEGPNSQKAACKRAWQELQATTFAKCGTCGATRAIEADHVDPYGKRDPKNKKVKAVSHYTWWSNHGGVPELLKEATKCEPLCRMCHTIKDTGKAGNRARHPDEYPVVRYTDDPKAYCMRNNAQIVYPRQQYVDALKRHLGGCAHLHCPGGEGPEDWIHKHPQCGDWDHVDEADKEIKIARIVCLAKKVRVAEWKAAINAEVRKCRLLCKNCHHCRTLKGLAIETIPRDAYLIKIEAAIAAATEECGLVR